MAVTRPVDVPDWIPGVISASFYDRLDAPQLTLTGLAEKYNDLTGRPGETIRVPYAGATTPAANLAVDVPAVDDSLTSGAFTMTMKEGVKSIAWYDRTQIQSGQDVNQIAGAKLGDAMEHRVELDLGAALVAGRTTANDAALGTGGLTVARIRAMKRQIPARLRKRGLVLVGTADDLDTIFDDTTFTNADTGGSADEVRNGAIARPIAGVSLIPVDDLVLPDITVATVTGRAVVMFARGMLGFGFQKNPTTETERDARARLTRHVGTMLHAEGTLEAAGIVARRVGA